MPQMPLLGAHMSIAGGYYKAVDAAADVEMNCVQLFCKGCREDSPSSPSRDYP